MAQMAKLETKAEITNPPAKVYDFLKYNLNKFVDLFPQVYKSFKLIEGEEGHAGNVKIVEYVIGKTMTAKVKTEEINDEQRSMIMRVIEGEVLKLYPTLLCKISVSDGCVNWSIQFEKTNDSTPKPDAYAQVAAHVTKLMDLYLLTN
ncbi:MLP-like protein 165 [Salvia hispanica]|uniref:MLP-like protein 165 n=1 Tax=Salvia hispanica TaxID=49212 RepID=UPI0020094371|nr:MLP-like protein 165 [Salvia hispanica]